MNTSEKMKFVVDSLSEILKSHSKHFKKSNMKRLKSIEDSLDYTGMNNLMTEALAESIKAMDKWEDTGLDELDGLTPKQYFESLSNINELIELYTMLEGMLPGGLIERVKKFEDSLVGDVLEILDTMDLGEGKCLNPSQKAVVHIVEILGNPQFINPLLKVVAQLDDEKSDEDTFNRIMGAIRSIGEPMLEYLINLVDNGTKNDRLYTYLILTIGKIASGSKCEWVYSLIKDRFRKSEKKYIEANALAVYGDGRAIPAIRGYVEKNIEDLPYWEYNQFREAVLLLGGNMSDLDEYFDDYEDYDEFDDEDEFYDE